MQLRLSSSRYAQIENNLIGSCQTVPFASVVPGKRRSRPCEIRDQKAATALVREPDCTGVGDFLVARRGELDYIFRRWDADSIFG
jgi:hypothetical protein